MNPPNEDRKPTDNMELLKQQAAACGPGCGCHAPGASSKMRWVLGVIVLVAAGTLVARAVIKNNGASAATPAAGFTTTAINGQTIRPCTGRVGHGCRKRDRRAFRTERGGDESGRGFCVRAGQERYNRQGADVANPECGSKDRISGDQKGRHFHAEDKLA